MLAEILLMGLTAAKAPDTITGAVVRIESSFAHHDPSAPWTVLPGGIEQGSGFAIDGGRILTNAHVVHDARQITVKRNDGSAPTIATVEAVAWDCDLAVLRVADKAFWKGLKPLRLGDLPRTGSSVVTYGYPMGGQEISSTAGVVSRIEWLNYVFSGADAHLGVQTDAAINPGSSGGPVVQNGAVVGVAFQNVPGSQSLGYVIPVPVIQHVLDDLKDGHYDGFPDTGTSTQSLASPALRRERGIPADRTGVVVEGISHGGTTEGVLQPGDVLLAVDGKKIADDGTVPLAGERVSFHHFFDVKQVGEPVELEVWRGGQAIKVKAVSRREAWFDRHRMNKEGALPYLVHAGLVFTALRADYLRTWAPKTPDEIANFRYLSFRLYFLPNEQPDHAEEDTIVLSRVLRDPVNADLSWPGPSAVKSVNGRAVHSLADVSAALAGNQGRYQVLEFAPSGKIGVIDREKALQAHAAILSKYGIAHDQSP
jgi:S1-C subfamily serine protease